MIRENDLPDGWKVVELLEHLNLVKSGVTDFSGFKKYVATGSLKTGKIIDYVEVDCETRPSRANMEVEENDIIFAKMKDTMKVFRVSSDETKYIFSTGFSILRVMDYEIIHPDYVFYWLKSSYFQNQKNKECTGATQKAINESKLKKFKIPLPPLQTQKKIVVILEKAERLKEWRKEADVLTDEFLKSTFLEMFGDPVTNTKGFKTQKLGDISDVKSGLTLNGQRRANKNNLHPYLRVANVFRNKLDLSEIKYIHVSDSEIDKILLKKNDVLIVEGHGNIEEIGRAAVWDEDISNCVHQNHIIRARLDEKHMQAHFSTYFLNIYGNFGYFPSKSRTTSGLNTISTNKVRKAEILSPPIDLQQKFASIVQQVEQMRNYQQESKAHTDNLFNALMQKAFKGELN